MINIRKAKNGFVINVDEPRDITGLDRGDEFYYEPQNNQYIAVSVDEVLDIVKKGLEVKAA